MVYVGTVSQINKDHGNKALLPALAFALSPSPVPDPAKNVS